MLKAFKYKLNPSDSQKVFLNKHFGCSRFIFNYYLNQRITEYTNNSKSLSVYDNYKDLTALKGIDDFNWLREVNSQSLQASLKNLDTSFKNFFKHKKGFPNFKSKHKRNSFCVPQNVKVSNKGLIIPKLKQPIKMITDREFKGEIRQCTISKTPTNEYFVSILVETNHTTFEKTGKVIGIDLGLKDFVITSDGDKYSNNRYTKKYTKKLKVVQQHLSRKVKKSNRYIKQRIKVARIHKKITNSRVDNLHKVSTKLIKDYDLIAIEDLNVKGMVKNKKLSKHISDAAWGTFVTMMTYKAEWNDKLLVKIDRFYPSSKTCNCCGYVNNDLKLSDRSWTCPACNTELDRDINASKNILSEGYKIINNNISVGTTDYRRGENISPTAVGTLDEASKILDKLVKKPKRSLALG
jgi:putative transposase